VLKVEKQSGKGKNVLSHVLLGLFLDYEVFSIQLIDATYDWKEVSPRFTSMEEKPERRYFGFNYFHIAKNNY